MKPLTKLYLKAFLITGIPYGLIMLGLDLAEGHGFRLWKLIFTILFFGSTMSLILVSFHRYRLKKNGIQEITSENLRVNQSKNIEFELNRKELVDKLKSDPIIRRMKMIETEDGILIKSRMTWKSWGENIKINLNSTKDTIFEYQVSSSPNLRTTLIDYGKNLENINRIEKVLKSIA